MNYQPLISPILSNFATSAEFITLMGEVFGQNIEIETLQQQWLNQNWTLPTVEVVNSSVINGALGAYSAQTGKIYLSQELIDSNNTDSIIGILLEEYGHHVDALLNVTDTLGDEGELFSLLVRGITPSAAEFNRISTENDHATIVIDGQEITIEMGYGVSINTAITSVNTPISINGTGTTGFGNDIGVVVFGTAGSVSSTGNATITITGQGSTTSTGGLHAGFFAQSGGFITSVDGAIAITGTGGTGTDNNRGVNLQSGSYISSTNIATITLTGNGSTTSTAANNDGIRIIGTNTRITSVNGAIAITGTGGAGTNNNRGISILGTGSISSTGNATISVTGNGSTTATGTNNEGVRVDGASSQITSLNGNINVTGTGGNGTSNNYGVYLFNGGTISSTGTANITIMGTGGSGTTSDGITIQGTNSKIQSNTGSINLTGTATGSNFGINILTGTSILSTSGGITLLGNTINLDNNSTISSSGLVFVNFDSDGQSGSTTLGATVTATASTLFLNDTIKVNYNTTGSRFDTINLTGALNLNGSTLDLDFTSYTATAGQRFTLIDNDLTDVVTGTFTGLAEGAKVGTRNSLDIFITYQGGSGNDVQLYTPSSNQAPTDLAFSANIINENVDTTLGVFLGDITISDVDTSGNNNVLTIEGIDAASFQIRNSNELYFIGTSPNFETQPSYDITLKSTDGALIYSEGFTVVVNDINEVPNITSGVTGTVAENAPTTTVVYTATATDPDNTSPNNTIGWSLSGTDASDFTIDSDDGEVRLNVSGDFEVKNSYSINVIVTDINGSGLVATKAVTINITDVNEVPNTINGTSGNDTFIGGIGQDIINGGSGNDSLNGGNSDDTLNGGSGNDTLIGGIGNDNLLGGSGNDNLIGGIGQDIINGGSDNDTLTGGIGQDVLTGGSGSDGFRYQTLTDSLLANYDLIKDFNVTQDKFFVTTTPTVFTLGGSVTALTETAIALKLTTANFVNDGYVAQFKFGSSTFVAINDNVAGFQSGNDAIVEFTTTGTLALGNFVIA